MTNEKINFYIWKVCNNKKTNILEYRLLEKIYNFEESIKKVNIYVYNNDEYLPYNKIYITRSGTNTDQINDLDEYYDLNSINNKYFSNIIKYLRNIFINK